MHCLNICNYSRTATVHRGWMHGCDLKQQHTAAAVAAALVIRPSERGLLAVRAMLPVVAVLVVLLLLLYQWLISML
jgi:hypothetical protein